MPLPATHNLQELYERTKGFSEVPDSMSPSHVSTKARGLLRPGVKLLARGQYPTNETFEIFRKEDTGEVWMDTLRPNGIRRERQHYIPGNKAYALVTYRYNARGDKTISFTAQDPRGRLVESIEPNEQHVSERVLHVYPGTLDDVNREHVIYGSGMPFETTSDRFYRDEEGQLLQTAHFFADHNGQSYVARTHSFHDDGRTVKEITIARPEGNFLESRQHFLENGAMHAQTHFDENGKPTQHIEYYTDGADVRERRNKQLTLFEGGFPSQQFAYYGDGKTLKNQMYFHPKSKIWSHRMSYTPSGAMQDVYEFDAEGLITHFTSYYTQGAEDALNPSKHIDQIYASGVLQTQLQYRPDGTLAFRRDVEADGATLRQYQAYDETGTHAMDVRHFDKGIISKQELYTIVDDAAVLSTMNLFDEQGRAYRGRRLHREDDKEFWDEIEFNPETGHAMMALVPSPVGLERHTYDGKDGHATKSEFFAEPELGEQLQRVVHYYNLPTQYYQDGQMPILAKREELFDEDGQTMTHAHEFRTDGTIKFLEWRDNDGRWVRRAYSPGTENADHETPFIYERITGEDGHVQRTELRAHNDAEIISITTRYNGGTPADVTIENLDGEETLSWQDYCKRKTLERESQPRGLVRLATVSPVQSTHDDTLELKGYNEITLQGEELALRGAASRLKHKIPGVRCESYTQDRKWLQIEGEPGHYVQPDADVVPLKATERVNVLRVLVPYGHSDGDHWPASASAKDADGVRYRALVARARIESSEALKAVHRNSQCDLGLNIQPRLLHYNPLTSFEAFQPMLHITWNDASYLPEGQSQAVATLLQEKLMHRRLDYLTPTGASHIDALVPRRIVDRKEAEAVTLATQKQLTEGLVPRMNNTSRTQGTA